MSDSPRDGYNSGTATFDPKIYEPKNPAPVSLDASKEELLAENAQLRLRLEEAEKCANDFRCVPNPLTWKPEK